MEIVRRTTLALAVTGFLFAGPGCETTGSSKAKQHTVGYHHQAGEVTLSIPTPTPWDDVKDLLSPGFEMSGKKALEQGVAITLRQEEAYRDAIMAKLRVSLPTMSFSETKTTSQTNQSDAVTILSRTEEERSGNVTNAPNPSSSNEVPRMFFATNVESGTVTLDRMLQHHAAMALNQEVQLLNNYLKHVVDTTKYEAYVVRAQVGVIPHARNEPYDTYCTLAFFPEKLGGSPPVVKGQQAAPQNSIKLPIVVPLIVSDNLEGALHARTVEQLRQFALGIAAMLKGVGLQGDFERLKRSLDSVLGTDLNSLLSVGQIAPNIVRVRFGAMNQPDSRYAMVPRNNYVSLLMLVEKTEGEQHDDDRNWQAGMTTEFRHATTGISVKARPPAVTQSALQEIIMQGGLTNDSSSVLRGALLECIEQRNLDGFLKKGDCIGITEANATFVWTKLAELRLHSQNRIATFRLPPPKPKSVLPASTQSSVLVILKDSAQLILRGGSNLSEFKGLGTSLRFTHDQKTFTVPASQLAAIEDGTALRADFPSLAEVIEKAAPTLKFVLEGKPVGNEARQYPVQLLTLFSTKDAAKNDEKPAFVFTLRAPAIVAKPDGTGACELVVTKAKDAKADASININISGASIKSATKDGSAVSISPKGVPVSGDAVIVLDLYNLVDRTTVIFKAEKVESIAAGVQTARTESK
jgi:hypothetical protein